MFTGIHGSESGAAMQTGAAVTKSGWDILCVSEYGIHLLYLVAINRSNGAVDSLTSLLTLHIIILKELIEY